MLPGPTEPNATALQNYLKPIVDDLLVLYERGTVVQTDKHPNGERDTDTDLLSLLIHSEGIPVRVALVGIIADHPAMVKICGFADHGHSISPCTKCTVSQEDIFTDESLRNGNLDM